MPFFQKHSPRRGGGNQFYQELLKYNNRNNHNNVTSFFNSYNDNKMAASGVQEHNEARRKDHVILRKAFLERERRAGFECGMVSGVWC